MSVQNQKVLCVGLMGTGLLGVGLGLTPDNRRPFTG